MAQADAEITSLLGQEIYATDGVFIGSVEDIALDFEKERVKALAVAETNPDLVNHPVNSLHGVLIPYRWVREVGDIIIIADIINANTSEE